MIISDKYKFIFIHNKKTAGSSVCVQLARFLGDKDLMIGVWADAAKYGILPNEKACDAAFQNKFLNKLVYNTVKTSPSNKIKQLYAKIINSRSKKYYRSILDQNPGHSSIKTIKSLWPDKYNNYFKFCIIRNPYEQ